MTATDRFSLFNQYNSLLQYVQELLEICVISRNDLADGVCSPVRVCRVDFGQQYTSLAGTLICIVKSGRREANAENLLALWLRRFEERFDICVFWFVVIASLAPRSDRRPRPNEKVEEGI